MFASSDRRDASERTFAYFGLDRGRSLREPPGLRVVEDAGRRGRRGDLCALVTAPADATPPEDICEALLDVIEDTYYDMGGSVTRGLRAALLAANTLLFERNISLEEEHRLVVGINCAVLRGEDIYIGQLGPAFLLVVHGDEVVRYPSDTVWLRAEEPGTFDLKRDPPVGLRRDVEPDLFHETFAPEDVMLLTTPNLARLVSDEDLIGMAARTEDGALRDGLTSLTSGQNLTVIVVEGAARQVSAVGGEEEEILEPEPVVEPEAVEGEEPPPAVPMDEDEDASRVEQEETWQDEEEYVQDREGGMSVPDIDLEGVRQQVGNGVRTVRQRTEDFLLRVLPEEAPERPEMRRESREDISLSGRALVVVALIIPLLMLFIVVMTRIQYNKTRLERFDSLRRLAQSRYDAAMRSEDNEEQLRQGLCDALDTVEKGLAIRPEEETLQEIKRRAVHRLDQVDRVERLYNPWKLRDLDDEDMSKTDSSRIVVHDIDVFLLNCGSDRVYKFLLNDVGDALQSADKDTILMQKGDSHEGVRVSDIVDITWLEAGGQRSLSTFVALERAGSLLAYDPQQGVDLLPVANSDQWLNPQAIAGYHGNLYLLDPLLGHVLKYMPSNNAYTNPPDHYLEPRLDVDLTGAVDMAIDGNVYILFADGHIEKFYEGEPKTFSMNGLPSPMRSPTTLFVSGSADGEGAEGYVYVTDTGNGRIVQFDKSGNYIRQFRDKMGGTRLEALRAVYVDESSGRLFWLSDRTLWLANLPSLT
ncbi:MAG: hypothetical protein ACQEQT_08385 [Chloroflexota bacterium]